MVVARLGKVSHSSYLPPGKTSVSSCCGVRAATLVHIYGYLQHTQSSFICYFHHSVTMP